MMAWKRADLRTAMTRLIPALILSFLVIALMILLRNEGSGLSFAGLKISSAALGFGLAAWLGFSTLMEYAERIGLFRKKPAESWARAKALPRSSYGMTLAHLGMAVAILGMIGSTLWKGEEVRILYDGDKITNHGYTITFQGVKNDPGPNYSAQRGHFIIEKDGEFIGELKPAKRFYPVQQMPTTESAIHPSLAGDLYITLGDRHEDGGWTVRVFNFPLIGCLWIGCVMMVLGGVVSLSDRRLRVGAPGRKRQTAPSLGAGPAPAAISRQKSEL